jgi:hypothetical protein
MSTQTQDTENVLNQKAQQKTRTVGGLLGRHRGRGLVDRARRLLLLLLVVVVVVLLLLLLVVVVVVVVAPVVVVHGALAVEVVVIVAHALEAGRAAVARPRRRHALGAGALGAALAAALVPGLELDLAGLCFFEVFVVLYMEGCGVSGVCCKKGHAQSSFFCAPVAACPPATSSPSSKPMAGTNTRIALIRVIRSY